MAKVKPEGRGFLKKVYDAFSGLDDKEIRAFDFSKIFAVPDKDGKLSPSKKEKNFGLSIRLMARLAANTESFEEFIGFYEGKELPPMKLGKDEMEAMRGGGDTSIWGLGEFVKTSWLSFANDGASLMRETYYGTLNSTSGVLKLGQQPAVVESISDWRRTFGAVEIPSGRKILESLERIPIDEALKKASKFF